MDEVGDTPSKKAHPSKSNVVNGNAQTPTRRATKLVMRVERNNSDKKPKDEHDDNDVTPHKKADKLDASRTSPARQYAITNIRSGLAIFFLSSRA